MKNAPFWQTKTLAEMDRDEWESLCDGCGLCCLHKLEDEDSGEIAYTNVACRLLDHESCRCMNYSIREILIPDCVVLSPDQVAEFNWLPPTCAYRLVSEGRELFPWHPLVSGDRNSVHTAGISVRGKAVHERDALDLEDHIIDWNILDSADESK
ncbi:YcgN family cysteine cluster protein [Emcibacter sp.]|uniref:YcgN family cysteine cluster protein n=1 Tax=Emcibacter sp. TaxID=1979954 RepID=UPI003B63840C